MTFSTQTIATISRDFKRIIQSGNYEQIILELMNLSEKVFPDKYIKVEFQSDGQCDFVNTITNEKYDAKLPITTEQGKAIGTNEFEQWLQSMLNSRFEYSEKMIRNRGNHTIDELTLYKTMAERITRDKEDEHIIFFFPFPITDDITIHNQFCGDILSHIFEGLQEHNIIKNRNIYVIYPIGKNRITLRFLNKRIVEQIETCILAPFISFDIQFYSHL